MEAEALGFKVGTASESDLHTLHFELRRDVSSKTAVMVEIPIADCTHEPPNPSKVVVCIGAMQDTRQYPGHTGR